MERAHPSRRGSPEPSRSDLPIALTAAGSPAPGSPVAGTSCRAFPANGGSGATGDRHAVVVDRSRCRLYETWATSQQGGRWTAGSGATRSLTSNALRPDGWTFADAAGPPILPGLLRWNEVRHGYVDHAIRFTTDMTSRRAGGQRPAVVLPGRAQRRVAGAAGSHLKRIPASAFVAVDTRGLRVSGSSARVR